MDVLDAIHQRRSAGKMKTDALPRGLIEKLLDAAVQAPNHYKVRPWRFVVLTGNGLNKLGDVMAESLKARFPDLKEEALNKERTKPLRSPLIIAVGVDTVRAASDGGTPVRDGKPTESKVIEIENICAAAAACQNILLAAHSLGLGAHWRTGDAARDPRVKKFLGFAEDQHVIAFLYIGYPEAMPEPPDRVGFEDRTVWME